MQDKPSTFPTKGVLIAWKKLSATKPDTAKGLMAMVFLITPTVGLVALQTSINDGWD